MRVFPACVLAAALATATLPAQLSGAYTVGPAQNYPNIAAAITALTTSGVSGPVTFYVTANDIGPWTIPSFTGQGAANPVTFEALGGPITISGTQPVLTLAGCASVTFRGFTGTFVGGATNSFVISGTTSDCVFTGCDFRANVVTSGVALFNFSGGSNCRIEDSTFGGAYESLLSAVANTGTTVQRCRIIGGGWRIMTAGGSDFTLVNNFITGTSNYGINAGLPGTPTSGAGIKILHNSVHIVHPTSGSQYCSLRWYSNSATSEVKNNIFSDVFPTPSTTVFTMWCSGALRPAQMNYNCLWSNQPGWVPVYASGNQTFAMWQALGFDVNSVQADPQFVAPGATPPDLHLLNTSPITSSGTFLVNVLTDFDQAARTPPVSIGAHENDSASYTVFGPGCPGTAGVPTNTASGPPQLGAAPTITFGNLPFPFIAIAVLGVSNTFTSGVVPLPLDLTVIGMPGCNLRVSLDVTLAVVGAGGSAGFVFGIPNQPNLIGYTFYTQGIVLDPGLNPFGFSASDAARAVVGL